MRSFRKGLIFCAAVVAGGCVFKAGAVLPEWVQTVVGGSAIEAAQRADTLIYSILFGTGNVLFGHFGVGIGELVFGAVCASVLFWNLNRLDWNVFK